MLPLVFGCEKFLDRKPESALSPEQYLTTEDNLASFATDLYNTLPAHTNDTWGTQKNDAGTDNMAYSSPDDRYAPGYWKVGQTGGSYSFTEIYRCNYFFDKVLGPFSKGEIEGSPDKINHYVGEVYFFRAWCYFAKLQSLGDFPIITTCPSNRFDELVALSVRKPQNEVARFIIEDLDKAIELLKETAPVGGTNRLSKDCARLLKSRVALYEGTWLKNFKGTAFVPGTLDWPGNVCYPDYQYPAGSIDDEIEFFLSTCLEESKIVADRHPLVESTGFFQSGPEEPSNEYFDMFGASDMSPYNEILLWRPYSISEGITNSVVEFSAASNSGYGTTKSMVDAFVMANGLPIYAAGSGYEGDADLKKITKDRDSRAELFIKKPGDRNLHSSNIGPETFEIEPYPNIVNSTASMKYTTGYTIRKGLNFDAAQSFRNRSTVGCIIFRAAEAYLNYMEACYVLEGSLDGDAQTYWNAIRNRSHVGDYQTTIDHTNMQIEGRTDWGAYTAGKLVDPILYNIRRERRCEFMGEGMRLADLRRWRAMDQMIITPCHIYGVNLWDKLSRNDEFLQINNNDLRESENVSPKSFSRYFAPYHILKNNHLYDGCRWNMAHYLEPIAVQHFLITGNGDVNESTLYQNPGWPKQAGLGAE